MRTQYLVWGLPGAAELAAQLADVAAVERVAMSKLADDLLVYDEQLLAEDAPPVDHDPYSTCKQILQNNA